MAIDLAEASLRGLCSSLTTEHARAEVALALSRAVSQMAADDIRRDAYSRVADAAIIGADPEFALAATAAKLASRAWRLDQIGN